MEWGSPQGGRESCSHHIKGLKGPSRVCVGLSDLTYNSEVGRAMEKMGPLGLGGQDPQCATFV